MAFFSKSRLITFWRQMMTFNWRMWRQNRVVDFRQMVAARVSCWRPKWWRPMLCTSELSNLHTTETGAATVCRRSMIWFWLHTLWRSSLMSGEVISLLKKAVLCLDQKFNFIQILWYVLYEKRFRSLMIPIEKGHMNVTIFALGPSIIFVYFHTLLI